MFRNLTIYLITLLIFSTITYSHELSMEEDYLNNNNNNGTNSSQLLPVESMSIEYIEECHPPEMTLQDIREILDRRPCLSFHSHSHTNRRHRRWLFGRGDTEKDIMGLQNNVKEHRNMINVLVNSSLNATFVLGAIKEHHENIVPNMSSWRDVTQLILVAIVLIAFCYLLLCRSSTNCCQQYVKYFFKSSIPNYNNNKEYENLKLQIDRLEKQFEEFQKRDHSNKKTAINEKPNLYPSTISLNSDVAHFHNRSYIAE